MTRIRKRDLEGYVEVDHRDSPGITCEEAAAVGSRLAVPAGTVFKSATKKCNHCEYLLILNPDRSRSRGYCRTCDNTICDRCTLLLKLGHPCRPFSKFMDEVLTKHANLKGML